MNSELRGELSEEDADDARLDTLTRQFKRELRQVDGDQTGSQRPVSGRRKALIFANDEYEYEALRNLQAPEADAEALAHVLGDPQIGGFSVQVIPNEPSHAMLRHIEDLFSESRPADVLLLYFSGHGLKNDAGELFLAASNTRPDRLASTAVPAQFVQGCMRETLSQSVVLLLDCCYSGAFGQGVGVRAGGDANVLDNFAQAWPGGGRGRAVITASNAMEYAFEGGWLAEDWHRGPSVFTGALVEGLATGDADRDEDTYISLDELYAYVFEKVKERNPHQTPSRKVDLAGDLYIARSRRRRIRPAPIRADIQRALDSQDVFTRRGAVHELESLVNKPELPVAAGAYQALVRVADDDIEYVAVAAVAAAAVARATVHLEETHLDFGTQHLGAGPVHRMIPLLGPPIARACTSRASHEWIGINEVGVNETVEGLDIWIDTTATGTFRGNISIEGTTGNAEITVAGEVVPPADDGRLSPDRTRGSLLSWTPRRFTGGTADALALTGGGDRAAPAAGIRLRGAGGSSSSPDRRVLVVVLLVVVLLAVAALAAFLPGRLGKGSANGPGPARSARPSPTTPTATVPAVPAGDCATGSITLMGGAFSSMASAAASAYTSECQHATIKVNPVPNSDSAYGVDQVKNAVKDHLAQAGSLIAMYDGQTTDASGLRPYPVGILVYSVVAHTGAVPGSTITIAELEQLYTQPEGLPGKIGVSLQGGSGTRQALFGLWQEKASDSPVPGNTCVAGGGPAPSRPRCLANSYSAAVGFVNATSNAIGYMAVDRVAGGHPSIKVNGPYTSDPQTSVISINGVAPTVENVVKGTYPYVAVEHLYLPPNPSALAKSFLAYLRIYLASSHFNDFAPCSAALSVTRECAASH